MTPRQFDTAIAGTRMPTDSLTCKAARMVLVDGISRNKAAKVVGISPAAVTRAVQRLQPYQYCQTCGQRI